MVSFKPLDRVIYDNKLSTIRGFFDNQILIQYGWNYKEDVALITTVNENEIVKLDDSMLDIVNKELSHEKINSLLPKQYWIRNLRFVKEDKSYQISNININLNENEDIITLIDNEDNMLNITRAELDNSFSVYYSEKEDEYDREINKLEDQIEYLPNEIHEESVDNYNEVTEHIDLNINGYNFRFKHNKIYQQEEIEITNEYIETLQKILKIIGGN